MTIKFSSTSLKYLLLFATLINTPCYASDTLTTADGVVIDYEITGAGAPLVLLHSGMMSRDDMQLQVDYFSKYYQVIALDSREQGRSTSSTSQISYRLMSNDVIELLDHLGLEKASIFGQSDGGITALITTFYHPERISKLMIHGSVYNCDAYTQAEREGMRNITWDANNPKDTDPKGFPGMSIESYLLGRSDLSQFESHLQEMGKMWADSPNLKISDLNTIKTPTLIIVGDHWDISLSHTIEMHEALSNSELFVAPGATHYIHQEKPALLHKVLHDFLRD